MKADPVLRSRPGPRRVRTTQALRRVGIATHWVPGCPASVCALPTKAKSPGGPMAFGWIDEEAERRRRAGLVRTLRPRPADSPLLDLASNDYLGLARHPEVTEGAARAARTWGGGATGSRLVTGTTALHAELERELADFCGFEAALVFSSG